GVLADALKRDIEQRRNQRKEENRKSIPEIPEVNFDRPKVASDSAKELIESLQKEVRLVQELGAKGTKVIAEQTELKRTLARLDKQIAEEQRSNAKEQVIVTEEQKKKIEELIVQR